MPKDSTPRSLDFFILKSPGNTAPQRAAGIFRPIRTLLAPQTICRASSVPTLTWHTRRRSASGCCCRAMTSPMTTPLNCAAAGSTEPISRPAIVNCSTSSSVFIAGSTYDLNQAKLICMIYMFLCNKNLIKLF